MNKAIIMTSNDEKHLPVQKLIRELSEAFGEGYRLGEKETYTEGKKNWLFLCLASSQHRK